MRAKYLNQNRKIREIYVLNSKMSNLVTRSRLSGRSYETSPLCGNLYILYPKSDL